MKNIPGYNGRYKISRTGIVTSFVGRKPRELKWKLGTDGYPRVALAIGDGSPARWFMVHRMILLTYVGPCPQGMEARHLNGDPLKPSLNQLAWGTHSENVRDKRRHGTDHNVNRTHCSRGHKYTQENTRIRTDRGWKQRECRQCGRDANKRYRAKKKVGP